MPDAAAAQRGGVLVDEIVGDERGDGLGIARRKRFEVADADLRGRGLGRRRHDPLPQTSCTVAYTPWS